MAELRAISQQIVIRTFAPPADSPPELTDLLHRAYKLLGDMGMRYWATHQTVEDTLNRIAGGTCLVAVIDSLVIGTATYHYPSPWRNTRWYQRDDVAHFGQFAVEPNFQLRGIGGKLLAAVEELARNDGAAELALNTAERAEHLIDYYAKRGYRFIEYSDATLPNYRSVVMSKTLL